MTTPKLVKISVNLEEVQSLRMMLRLMWVERLVEVTAAFKARPQTDGISLVSKILEYEDSYRDLERQPYSLAVLFGLHPETKSQEWCIHSDYLAAYQTILNAEFDTQHLETVGWGSYKDQINRCQKTLQAKLGCTENIQKEPLVDIAPNLPPALGKN
jgi:hypothetical protein